jgi:mono/diheme cytochrome c family protein
MRSPIRLWAAACIGAVLTHGAAWGSPTLSVCIDSASASAARDQTIAEAVARQEGATLHVAHFDGANDDDGVSVKEFQKLLGSACSLVMGYPVDRTDPAAPPGTMQTKAYDETGFVLVVPAGSPAKNLADLPNGTKVAVTFETAPNLYFLRHANVKPDVHETDDETLDALLRGQVRAAMVWQPTLRKYLGATPSARLISYPLAEPHARWAVVALYTARGAEDARRFEATLAALRAPISGNPQAIQRESSSGFNPALVIKAAIGAKTTDGETLPALYTTAQATAGAAHYAAICAVCHGANLQGIVGPALKGPNFASVKAGFAVGDVFIIIANNMPASDPGTLAPDVYTKIMAFILQENGYPPGPTPLTYDSASKSDVPLLYHGK